MKKGGIIVEKVNWIKITDKFPRFEKRTSKRQIIESEEVLTYSVSNNKIGVGHYEEGVHIITEPKQKYYKDDDPIDYYKMEYFDNGSGNVNYLPEYWVSLPQTPVESKKIPKGELEKVKYSPKSLIN
jgi:hypothetical protein